MTGRPNDERAPLLERDDQVEACEIPAPTVSLRRQRGIRILLLVLSKDTES